MLDKIALNLLYIQTSSDVDRGWILTTNEIKDQLNSLQSNGNKKEVRRYIAVAEKNLNKFLFLVPRSS